jgi:glycerate kinase
MREAYAVVTGEGRLDTSTFFGKAAGEVAVRARQAGVPSHAIAGRNELDLFQMRILNLDTIDEAGTPAEIEAAARRLGTIL